ncbi:hypothetical protein LX16_3586 [Stackebrandtia albiflava]|uniref:Uncharacterized protein n=1 Tax=Stackebrandtia albiflava TaxID=406432 RepID=A0A562V4L8_9ACTN|nr:hypothetical protein [Stackebrandtia albiflava]TWJ12820.1 hypothetical protein LX16_3586 [Stackebrandtia albiflava]
MPDIETIGRESRRVVHGVAHWSPARWRTPALDGEGDRAQVMRTLVQTLADLAAQAEGEPSRTVPPPEHDTVLPDQLTVITADLVAARPGPEQCDLAAGAIRVARAGLFGSEEHLTRSPE